MSIIWHVSIPHDGDRETAIDMMYGALQRALDYVEADETTHGRKYGTGNEIRNALKFIEKGII